MTPFKELDNIDESAQPKTIREALDAIERISALVEPKSIAPTSAMMSVPKLEPTATYVKPVQVVQHGARTARAAEKIEQQLGILAEATRVSLNEAAATKKFSKGMLIASFAVGAGSLVVAVVALILQLLHRP